VDEVEGSVSEMCGSRKRSRITDWTQASIYNGSGQLFSRFLARKLGAGRQVVGWRTRSSDLRVVWWAPVHELELSQARDMGPPMKTLTQIIRHPCHRLELMRVEWNVIKSAGWLEIGIHTLARILLRVKLPLYGTFASPRSRDMTK